MDSLWLNPESKGRLLELERFRKYPFFFDAFDQYQDLVIPRKVLVKWESYGAFTKYAIEADDEEAAEEIENFIDDTADKMRKGWDIPPLLRDGRAIADGRHRAFAARALRIKKAPVVDISSWRRS